MTKSQTTLGNLNVSRELIDKASVVHTRTPGFPGMHLGNAVSTTMVRFNFSALHTYINSLALKATMQVYTSQPIFIAGYPDTVVPGTLTAISAAMVIVSGTSVAGFGGYLPAGTWDLPACINDVLCKRASAADASVRITMKFTGKEDDSAIFDYTL